ncbi:hypothetical protein HBI23_071760 [Parastagonospora nodorum]|nr:hypothetical protein HBI12_051800 [Parastagonospora nodorum]KAH5433785.1 hypothetical protein HBI47_089810 [Parastagonospora nodorum]KAH5665342.1 hypothetical protein HBI23_071760 [Parastagonospora nodorum]KAH6229274.1 hypothetical protein HBI43_052910 [Parastagonospora nodorum]KAH6268133.1 hypothetical protein HBI42_044270 [Parastagonospora nodorum]
MSTGWNNLSVSNGSQAGDDDIPACSSCKKRKLRCSRETPTCSHCQRLGTECVYNAKQKPGLKPGAVEALTRRVAFLERILLDDSGNIRPQYNDYAESDIRHPANDANTESVRTAELVQQADATDRTSQHQEANNPLHTHPKELTQEQRPINPLKRKLDHAQPPYWPFDLDDVDSAQHLPEQPILCKAVDFFCTSFHHWIPYIHKQRLQNRVREGFQSAGFSLVLHALVATTLRHMDPNVLFLDRDQVKRHVKISRSVVEARCIQDVSVESLQALVLVVFDHLNNGQPQRAWPLIGSLTRTIDYLQLTTEPSQSQHGSLMKPVRLLPPSNDWTELEERRRLFWVVFLLDRFCSISTGWNTSLTAEDVHRRLPADGGYFTREEPVTTPFFGIWNKAAARIGRSLAHLPAQYNEEDPAISDLPVGASPSSANGYIDASKLGAFAYCVEATESLSQVTTFFLQQRINWQDKEHAINWLTRFKELDLRLVQWKMFLPRKWADADISADRAVIDMDPNLTLAHITHNTSMILLHHTIAYPPRGWNDYVALPQNCSAQTCELAAIETSNIVDKFLTHSPIPFVNAQFAFCAYVAAKALLFGHQMKRKAQLRPEFQRLIRNLWEMSDRWSGKDSNVEAPMTPTTQSGIFANHLASLHDACKDGQFSFDLYDHSCASSIQQYASPIATATPRSHATRDTPVTRHVRHNSMNSSQSALSPRRLPSTTGYQVGQGNSYVATPGPQPYMAPSSYTTQHAMNGFPSVTHPNQNIRADAFATPDAPITHPHPANIGHNRSVQDQSLLTLSDTFLDSQFLDMDRVITFEDANFFIPWQ